MVYVDSRGNVVDSSPKASIISFFTKLFGALILFFQSLVKPFLTVASEERSRRERSRGNGGSGGGGWPGSGGPGGPRYDGGRRPIGRLNRDSGMSCAPVGG